MGSSEGIVNYWQVNGPALDSEEHVVSGLEEDLLDNIAAPRRRRPLGEEPNVYVSQSNSDRSRTAPLSALVVILA